VHTGNVSKKIILASPPDDSADYVPVREGKNISAFYCGEPEKWLWLNPQLDDGEYCRIRDLAIYRNATILLRQTANRPIAALHRSPTYFRNSVLACAGLAGIPDKVLVGFLNSSLYAFLHRSRFLDAGQKAFPQVKIKHLQSLPAVPGDVNAKSVDGVQIAKAVEAVVEALQAQADSAGGLDPRLLLRLDELVLLAFGESKDLAAELQEAIT
jgi:hypothetical protein